METSQSERMIEMSSAIHRSDHDATDNSNADTLRKTSIDPVNKLRYFAIGIVAISLIGLIVTFVTPYWLHSDGDFLFGLFRTCINSTDHCYPSTHFCTENMIFSSKYPIAFHSSSCNYFKITQGMIISSFFMEIISLLLLLFRPVHNKLSGLLLLLSCIIIWLSLSLLLSIRNNSTNQLLQDDYREKRIKFDWGMVLFHFINIIILIAATGAFAITRIRKECEEKKRMNNNRDSNSHSNEEIEERNSNSNNSNSNNDGNNYRSNDNYRLLVASD